MKLILRPYCEDVVRLVEEDRRYCRCESSWGQYHDHLRATYGGEAIPMGFSNPSLIDAARNYQRTGRGQEFVAFTVPRDSSTFTAEMQTKATDKES